MTIQWLGQACFKITYDGYSIVIDPYHTEMSGFAPLRTSADKVLVSHQHLGHNNVEAVQLSGTSRECPFQIETIQTHHDTLNGRMRGENLIHILTGGGMKLIHMGDVGIQQDDDRLRDADVIMSHCGSLRALSCYATAAMLRDLDPKVIIPMHYHFPGHNNRRYSTLQDLFDEFGDSREIVYYPTDTLEVKADMPKQIAVLKLGK